ncbi:MAG: radical SAM protein [Candidatus Poribacteria bacterium]
MATKSILINFNGCPSTIDSLMPDNGLANLAGSLLEEGHGTVIMDFSTVDVFRRMIPDEISKELSIIYEESIANIQSGNKSDKSIIGRLLELDRELENHKKLELNKIAYEIIDIATQIGTDFIGFKLWTGEGFTGSLIIAKIIKDKLPDVKLFAGGPHIDWFMERVFDYTDVFDVLAYGEGEETIKLLAEYSEGKRYLSDIPNIIYQNDGRINTTKLKRISDLNSLPDPVYDESVYLAMKDDQKINFVMIDESRGCPNSCNFCIHPQKSGKKWRKRDPLQTVDLMVKLGKQLNTYGFRLAGSNTPTNLRKEIAQEILRQGLNMVWTGFGHVKGGEDYELLKTSGCLALAFGVESGSQTILNQSVNKKVKVDDIVSAITKCKNAGISTIASTIVPCPYDTEETIRETLELLIRAKPDSVTLQLPGLIPGSDWYKKRDEFGFELNDDYMIKAMIYKIKLLLPPILWDPLPYRMNGRDHPQMMALAQGVSIELEKNGVLTGCNDFLALIGKLMGISLKEMRDINRRMFFINDYKQIKSMIKSFNAHVKYVSVLGVGGTIEPESSYNRNRGGSP